MKAISHVCRSSFIRNAFGILDGGEEGGGREVESD